MSKGGRGPKIKGSEFEREIVNQLRAAGINARRVPLSGAVPGYEGDLRVAVGGLDRKAECKRRKRAFGTLSAHLGTNDFLFVRDDRSPALVVMTVETFIALDALAFELHWYKDLHLAHMEMQNHAIGDTKGPDGLDLGRGEQGGS
jgi:hypothetical protein